MTTSIILDDMGRVSITKFETACPSEQWLAIQRIPFAANARFVRAFPLTGGSCIVDENKVDVLRDVTETDLDECDANNPWDVRAEFK